jgi:basic membrane protein A
MHRHLDRKSTLILPAIFVALVVAACSGSSTPTPAASVAPSPSPAAAASVAPSAAAPASVEPSPSPAATPLKVALIAPSSVNDLAFTQSMKEAVDSLKTKYNLDIAVSDNKFVVADAANVIQDYASKGYNLIIAHGSQYGSTIQQLAPQFPNISFAWGTAGSTFNLPNVFAYQVNSNEGGYVQGAMAALLSKSKVLGVIGPIAVGDAKLYVDGFCAGAKATVPSISCIPVYTGSFSDVSLMSAAATTFVANKADALTGTAQAVVGAIGVAKTANIPWFGTQWTQVSLADKNVVSSQVYNWAPILEQIITEIQGGKLGGATFTATLGNGGAQIQFNPGFNLPAEVKAKADELIKGITEGKVNVPQ